MTSTHDGGYESTLADFFPKNIKTDNTFLQSSADIFIMPPLFSRQETPQSYHFRRPPNSRLEAGRANIQSSVISKCK